MIGGAYNTTELGVMLDSFDPGNTYRLRVRVNHSKGASYNCYSDYVIFSTSTDPAVRAAQEAAIAAQAAKKATEDSVQYSTDAKNAALAAESKATEAVDLIKALDTKFTTQFTNVQDKLQPTILSVKTTNGATATKSGSINIVATAINASQYRYRVNNGAFSEWQLLPVININSLASGVNVIEVQATNSLEEGAPVASGYITVFRL